LKNTTTKKHLMINRVGEKNKKVIVEQT